MNKNSGYTLIEVMVTMVLIMVVLGGGIAAYRGFDQRQRLTNAGRQLANTLRDVQKRAQIGDKPDMGACETNQLEGWRIRSDGSHSFIIAARCDDTEVDEQVFEFEPDTSSQNKTINVSSFNLSFDVLTGRVSSSTSIQLTDETNTYTIEVSSAGGISDLGIN